jgi:transcription initiation factor TFIIIB Brf1 subunit/transcription initiation factor TFIIB
MSSERAHTFFSTSCLHEGVDDYTAGVRVCTLCGLVLEEQLYMPSFEHTQHVYCADYNNNLENATRAFLLDVCDRMHIYSVIISEVIDYMQYISTCFKEQNKRFRRNELAAYSLYYILQKQCVSRTMKDVAHHSGIPQKNLCAIESHIPKPPTTFVVLDVIEKYCSMLNIAFFDAAIIKCQIIKWKDEIETLHPTTIAATFIYMYAKTRCLNISMKSICDVCQVTSPNVHKIVRRLKKHDMKFSFID